MVWSLITLATGLALWGVLWLVAGWLEKKASQRKQAETPEQSDLSYED